MPESTDGGQPPVQPVQPVQPDQPDQPGEPDHRTDGLDLARSIARAYRRPGGTARRPRRRATTRMSEAEASGAYPDDRDPQTLEAAMDRLIVERGWRTDVAVHQMFGRWDAIVGAEVAQHCTPQHFDDGQLTVLADSTAWATQMTLLAPMVVAKLNERLGDGSVLRIVVRGPQAPSWRKGSRSVRGRGPRDTYG